MKKLLSGEKIGLKIEPSKISFLFFFLLLSPDYLPQIPINGFCKLNFYRFSNGYAKIFALNYNNDAYTDLILFNPSTKKISIAAGEQNESFGSEKLYDFPFHISNITAIREEDNRITKYAFTSRKNLTAGICEFPQENKPKVTHQLKFNSYPENISAADVDGDNKQEVLISGRAFEGLSLIKISKDKLSEHKISAREIYSHAIFVDLSNDQFADIAAVNLLKNSIEFYFNNGRGEFKFTRSIRLANKPSNLLSFDMNLDSYPDLIFSDGNSLKIIYGDFSSSYSKQITVTTKYFPDDVIVGDFNKDGKIDIAYLNLDTSIISAIFQEDEYLFYEEVLLIHKPKIKNIIPFYSKFIDGLAAVCEDGTVFSNTKISSPTSDLNLSLSLMPLELNSFDANSDGIFDLCLIDGFDNKLKLIVRNGAGIPSIYYSIALIGNPDKVEVKNLSKNSTSFYCYAQGKRLIEVIDIDFNSLKIERSKFYTFRPIKMIKPGFDINQKVLVASLSNKKLFAEIFEKDGDWKVQSDYSISEKAISCDLSPLIGFNLFYWNEDKDSIKLFKKSLQPEEKSKLVLKLKMNNISSIMTIADDFYNLGVESVISFVESDEKQYILVSQDRSFKLSNLEAISRSLRIKNLKQMFVGEIRPNGTRRLIINNQNNKNIYRLNILQKGKKLAFTKLIEDIETDNYLIKNMTMNKFHVIYINKNDKCISIREI